MTPYEATSRPRHRRPRERQRPRGPRNRDRSVDLPAPASPPQDHLRAAQLGGRQSFFEDAQFGLAPHEAVVTGRTRGLASLSRCLLRVSGGDWVSGFVTTFAASGQERGPECPRGCITPTPPLIDGRQTLRPGACVHIGRLRLEVAKGILRAPGRHPMNCRPPQEDAAGKGIGHDLYPRCWGGLRTLGHARRRQPGIFALTLNWFDVATAFPLIGAEFKVGLGVVSFLISLYIVGYGLSAYPRRHAGHERWHEEDLGAWAPRAGNRRHHVRPVVQLHEFAFFRVVSGIGGSVFVAMTAAAMVVWFREKEVTLALGVTGGAAFSAGAAFRPLRLAVLAAGDRLACVAGPGRRLRTRRRGRDDRGVPGPRWRSITRWRQVRSNCPARLPHE
jgi:hypothetical protein